MKFLAGLALVVLYICCIPLLAVEPLLFVFVTLFYICLFVVSVFVNADKEEAERIKRERTAEAKKIVLSVESSIKDALINSYKERGYFSLPDDFISFVRDEIRLISDDEERALTSLNDIYNAASLSKVIKIICDKIIREILLENKFLSKYNNFDNLEYVLRRLNHYLSSYNISFSYDVNNHSKKQITYKDIIHEAAGYGTSLCIEDKDEATDLKEEIEQEIEKHDEVINDDDETIEEAIVLALDSFQDANVEDCIFSNEPIKLSKQEIPTLSYSFMSKPFTKVKPVAFIDGDDYEQKLQEWENEFKNYYINQARMILRNYIRLNGFLHIKEAEIQKKYANRHISNFFIDEEKYEYNIPKVVCAVVDSFLSQIQFPEYLKFSWDINYNEESKLVLIDLFIPSAKDFPCYKSCQRITKETKVVKFNLKTEKEIQKIYEEYIYKLVLNLINSLFELNIVMEQEVRETEIEYDENGNEIINREEDKIYNEGVLITDYIDNVAVNGIVRFTDDSDGRKKENCILSILTNYKEFAKIDISNVDYSKCFKRLKGISSAVLTEYVAINPIISFNKEDKRFIEGKEVLSQIDESINLAAMDWQEFENLVRDIFEKEFGSDGAEVKITQSSRDGGVDAVVFDPDPIRGGKIVIQAKRYTNVVNVSAVRDLYGTVLNEGANKGILVTTSNFGADSHAFAQNKPITLISGNELLYLLEKNGVKARIDIEEAKTIIKSKQV